MNGKIIAATVATALGVTVLLGGTLNYQFNDTLDPRAPFLRSKLTSLKKDENSSKYINEEVYKFYKNNGKGFLIATPLNNESGEFSFKYYPVGTDKKTLEDAKQKGGLKNWEAVNKFLELVKKSQHPDPELSSLERIEAKLFIRASLKFMRLTWTSEQKQQYELLNNEFKLNMSNHLNDKFIIKLFGNKRINPKKLDLLDFLCSVAIAQEVDEIVTDDEMLTFMNSVIPDFEERIFEVLG